MATNKITLPKKQSEALGLFLVKRELESIDIRTGIAVFRLHSPSSVKESDNPSISLPISSIRPGQEYDTQIFWAKLVDELIKAMKQEDPRISFVKGYEVTIGDDSTGDPALYIRVLVERENQYAPGTVALWNDFGSRLRSYLVQLGAQRYPYLQFGEKARKSNASAQRSTRSSKILANARRQKA